ncbi:MAG: glycosyltransferase family 2 protein [Burkholderiales bacterium]
MTHEPAGSAPLLSVCIPTYNRAKLLARHLEHLRGFRLELEIVVCDNHSADDTPALAAEFAGTFRRFRYVRLAGRRHPHQCWDSALRAATGEFVYAIGDDDLVAEDGIAELIAMMQREPRILAAIGAQELRELETDRFIRVNRYVERTEVFAWESRQALLERFAALEFPLMRRDVYQRGVLFDGSHRFYQWSFVEAALRRGQVAITPVVSFVHYLHGNRLTHEHAASGDYIYFNVVSETESFVATLDCDQATRARILARQLSEWYAMYAGISRDVGQYCGARLLIRKGMAHDPARFQALARDWDRDCLRPAMVELIRTRIAGAGEVRSIAIEEGPLANWLLEQLWDALGEDVDPIEVRTRAEMLDEGVPEDGFAVFDQHPAGDPRMLRGHLPGRHCACADLLSTLRLCGDEEPPAS